ncbi:MAG: hypothetical protein P9X24_05245, partial [Candidatus Hatepunaea meridiana]|nr:hypothetical protein [Candidatus Hatepunaea meridiana]
SSELEQLQREHVIDWLISNHDAHGKQFLRLKNGRLAAIDKSQTFKYLGEDKLSITYHPNHGWGEKEPFYNVVMRAWRDEKIDLDLQATYKYIRRMETITNEAYIEILKPYAERRFRGQPLKLKQFYETALARKNNIRNDFEKYYNDLLRKRTGDRKAVFLFDMDGKGYPEKSIGKWEFLPEDAEELITDAREAGWQGKSLPVDIDDIEDQNILLYTETVKKRTRTVMRMKIRPEAEKKLLANLSTGSEGISTGKFAGEPLVEDVFFDDILSAIKSINYHIHNGDFKFNKEAINKVLQHNNRLKKLLNAGDIEVKNMAVKYLDILKDIQGSTKDHKGKKRIGSISQYLCRKSSKRKSPIKGISAVKTNHISGDAKRVYKGQISIEKENAGFGSYHHRFTSSGVEYRIDLTDGVEAVYRPWVKDNYYAHQGQLELRVFSDCTPETADKLLSNLNRLGIEAVFSSHAETEIMYLSKAAYILKQDNTPAWKKMIKNLDNRKASKAERVQALRKYWSDQLGVADVTCIPGYDPNGKYSLMSTSWKKKRQAGYRHQLRFDLTDEQIQRELGNYGLYHSMTNSRNISNVLDTVLEHNGAMVSTVEKTRIGVPVGGMSPTEDMNTGGASYFFTRVRKLPGKGGNNAGFYFKSNLLRRMDAITYPSDKYGRVTGDHVRKHRKTSIEEYKRLGNGNSCDETIFKNEVTLLDNIQYITVRNSTDKKRVLDVFRKYGISKLPDGRLVTGVVKIVGN